MTTVKEVIESLKKYNPDLHVAVALWQGDDVIARAKEREMEIIREQVIAIIDRIDRRQDATLGITWDTIDCYLDDL